MVGPASYNHHTAKDYLRRDGACTSKFSKNHYGDGLQTMNHYYVGQQIVYDSEVGRQTGNPRTALKASTVTPALSVRFRQSLRPSSVNHTSRLFRTEDRRREEGTDVVSRNTHVSTGLS